MHRASSAEPGGTHSPAPPGTPARTSGGGGGGGVALIGLTQSAGGGQAARRAGGRAGEVQGSGFASDSLRVINGIRREAPALQILLFSATFDEQARRRLLPPSPSPSPPATLLPHVLCARPGPWDNGEQSGREGRSSARAGPDPGASRTQVKRFAEKTVPNANRVFIPKEELSLDVIRQYKVVGDPAAPVLRRARHWLRSKMTAGRVWGGPAGWMGCPAVRRAAQHLGG